jgi:hypothetical protein
MPQDAFPRWRGEAGGILHVIVFGVERSPSRAGFVCAAKG